MHTESHGLSLWYGTADAPAPEGDIPAGGDLTVTIGVKPTNANNTVQVRYRINQGPEETATAKWLRNEVGRQAQYFRAHFPAVRAGDTVEYAVICRCAGRQVSALQDSRQFASSFQVVEDKTSQARPSEVTVQPEPHSTENRRAVVTAPVRVVSKQAVSTPQSLEVLAPEEPILDTPEFPVVENLRQGVGHEVVGQLVDEQSGAHLAGYTVRSVDLDADAETHDLGDDFTDGRGLFTLAYTTLWEDSAEEKRRGATRRFRLHILSPDGEEVHHTEIPIQANQEQVVEVRVPAAPEPLSPTLMELANISRINLPQKLQSALDNHGIRTLADLRKKGGIRHIKESELAKDDPAVRTLDAHTSLSTLSATVEENAALIRKGVENPLDIARTPREDFIHGLREELGETKAAQLHAEANTQARYLNNVLTGLRVDQANGFKTLYPPSGEASNVQSPLIPSFVLEGQNCGCQDCESAVSPLAYLADLLDYALRNLKSKDKLITLEWLRKHFHQPFGDLPVTCEAMDEKVRQVRLCVEVLRSYLGHIKSDSPTAPTIPATSGLVEDLMFNPEPPPDPITSADSLGIVPIEPLPPALPPTFKAEPAKPSVSIGTPLFHAQMAYRRTAYEMLLNQIGTSYEALRVARRADAESRETLAQRLGIGVAHLDELLVDVTKSTQLTEEKLEQLFGLPDTTRDPLADNDRIPALQTWRLDKLRQLWRAQDFPDDAYRESATRVHAKKVFKYEQERLLFIDPDLIGPNDLRDPVDGNPVYELWKKRRAEVDEILENLCRIDPQANGLAPAVTRTLGVSLRDLQTLPSTSRNVQEEIRGLGLTAESYTHLMAINESVTEDNPLSDLESEEVVAILTQAQKMKQRYTTWITEERNQGIILGPQDFVIALEEPEDLPQWLASPAARRAWQEALRRRSEPARVDPYLLISDHFTYPWDDNPAYALWRVRLDWAEARKTALNKARETQDNPLAAFQSLLNTSDTGISLKSLMALTEGRDAGDDIVARLEQLSVTPAAFQHVISMYELASADATLLESEWDEAEDILLKVEIRRKTAEWQEEERKADLTLSPDYFAIPDPSDEDDQAGRSKWLANWREKRNWEGKLQARVEQGAAIIHALGEAVSATEEAALPMLRDALMEFSKKVEGTTLAAKAKWITDHLLIDAQTDGCLMTTQVSQAITTLQTLIWSVRTGQLKEAYPRLKLIEDALETFDKTWKWLGSYVSWRAAMLVFLYPENILVPALRRHQTPAFQKLIEDVRSRRLSPTDACTLARTYSDYFRDIGSLNLQVTCRAETRMGQDDSCAYTKAKTYHNLSYVFALGGHTGTAYWSAYDPEDDSGYAQTFWQNIEPFAGLDVRELIGVVPYAPAPNNRFLYLFARTGESALVYARYDLEQRTWEPEEHDLELPDGTSSFTAVVGQGAPGVAEFGQLRFVINGGGKVYTRLINTAGTDWADREFEKLTLPEELFFENIYALLHIHADTESFDLIWESRSRSEKNKLQLSNFLRQQDDSWKIFTGAYDLNYVLKKCNDLEWLGHVVFEGQALSGNKSSPPKLYAFWRCEGVTHYSYLDLALGTKENYRYPSTLERVVHDTGPPEGDERLVALQEKGDGNMFFGYFNYSGINQPRVRRRIRIVPGISHALSLSPILPALLGIPPGLPITDPRRFLLPIPQDLFEIPAGLQASEQYRRRLLLKELFSWSPDNPRTNRIYLEEAYFFVPFALALKLQEAAHYTEALGWWSTVYDYSSPLDERKIYPGLREEEDLLSAYQREEDFIVDPLEPHAIARTRRNTYTRAVLLSLVRCLLDAADAEFTRDNVESLARAKQLYMTALDLLTSPELQQSLGWCQDVIGSIEFGVGPRRLKGTVEKELTRINDRQVLQSAIIDVKKVLAEDLEDEERLGQIRAIAKNTHQPRPKTLGEVVSSKAGNLANTHNALLASADTAGALARVTRVASKKRLRPASKSLNAIALVEITEPVDRRSLAVMARQPTPVTEPTSAALTRPSEPPTAEPEIATFVGVGAGGGDSSMGPILDLDLTEYEFAPELSIDFCIPPNPIVNALRMRTELALHKLRTCRNIAGIKRELDPYAAPTDPASGLPVIGAGGQLVLPGTVVLQPTQYRFGVLLERSKQLVQQAAQIEAAMLSALEKRDAEHYNLLKSRQELNLQRAGVRLQELRVKEAESSIELAQLQQEGAQLQVDTYQEWLDAGMNRWECDMISAYQEASEERVNAARSAAILKTVNATLGATQANVATASLAVAQAAAIGIQAQYEFTHTANAIQAEASAHIASASASFERSQQQWELSKLIAEQGVRISGQNILIAADHVRVVGQEHRIAEMQAEYAGATVEFLTNKFTNVELYDWMGNVLEGVYSYFLQQATAMAKVAENQLAFERQEVPPAFIQTDYWESAEITALVNTNRNAPDRRGLTGSARLLQDISRLDQYAFETDKRKLQLSKTLSLTRLAPIEFQRFREMGVINFTTPMEIFDRDFPGHYLRLIKQVRTSVVALIPPNEGIKATLSAAGNSRVVIGGDIFQTVNVNRGPELVVLSSPFNATGLFELNPQPEMLLPFEGIGLDTVWEFRMPKASNPFDYRTIADVLITLEYTALNSYHYRQQVIQQLDTAVSADRPFSFRHEFADQWWDLHNSEQAATPMTIRFEIRREDFPPNIEELKIQHVVLYFVRKEESASDEVPVTHLRFTDQGGIGTVGGPATSIDGIISTRRGNAGSWMLMIGKTPSGKWELALPDTEEMRNRFQNEEIEDILFVITYSGHTPPWPT